MEQWNESTALFVSTWRRREQQPLLLLPERITSWLPFIERRWPARKAEKGGGEMAVGWGCDWE